ncbi:hypothetical protein SD208_18390 [Ochrobactrum sp. BD67]
MAVFVIFIRGGLQILSRAPSQGFCTASLSAYMMGMKRLRFNNGSRCSQQELTDERENRRNRSPGKCGQAHV